MHLVGFIIRIYYDARSPERQILKWNQVSTLEGETYKRNKEKNNLFIMFNFMNPGHRINTLIVGRDRRCGRVTAIRVSYRTIDFRPSSHPSSYIFHGSPDNL